MRRLRCGTLADAQDQVPIGGQYNRIDLVRLQRLADGRPRSVDAGIEQGLLDGNQQMVGQYAEKNMRLHPSLFVVKDRPLTQWRLECPKRCFRSRQQSVDSPG